MLQNVASDLGLQYLPLIQQVLGTSTDGKMNFKFYGKYDDKGFTGMGNIRINPDFRTEISI